MKTRLDKVTQLDNTRFPYSHKGEGASLNRASLHLKSKNSFPHPYMRPGFVFKCCDKH